MLKYQVRTLNRERKPRKSIYALFDDRQVSTVSSDSSPSPSASSQSSYDAASLSPSYASYDVIDGPGSPSGGSSNPGGTRENFDSDPVFCQTGQGTVPMSSANAHPPQRRGSYDADVFSNSGMDGIQRNVTVSDFGTARRTRKAMRSASVSSLSSGSSIASEGVEWGPIRIYTSALRSDADYKTLFINTATTASELVGLVLGKFARYRSKVKDPNLFYITMDIMTRHESSCVETSLVLESNSRPLELQNYHPRDKSRFSLQVRQGVQVKIFDYHVFPESNYKSLLVSDRTSCGEVVSLLYQSHRVARPASGVNLCVYDRVRKCAQPIPSKEILYKVLREPWINPEIHQVHVMPTVKKSLPQALPSLAHYPLTTSHSGGFARIVPASPSSVGRIESHEWANLVETLEGSCKV